jgi:hypothetical protein
MLILREWRADIRRNRKDACIDYTRRTGLADCVATPGNLGALIAIRDVDEERSEIVFLTCWASRDAIAAFAGDDIDIARYYPEDDLYLLTRPEKVNHYELPHGAIGLEAFERVAHDSDARQPAASS